MTLGIKKNDLESLKDVYISDFIYNVSSLSSSRTSRDFSICEVTFLFTAQEYVAVCVLLARAAVVKISWSDLVDGDLAS
jgi:hypothetical protein